MRRLTKEDWKIINAALALLQADAEDTADLAQVDSERVERRVAAVRGKVHERLGGDIELRW